MRRALLLLVLLLGIAPAATAQISPGPLSSAHEHLDGMRNCRTCHGGGDQGLDRRCLDCHQAVDRLISEGRGLHAREGTAECAHCHPEHAGRDFDLVDWGGAREDFDHGRAGYVLNGAHARLKCEQCHQEKNQVRNVLLRRPEGSGPQTWLGLDPSRCVSCHQSPHSPRIGSDCAGCHDESTWTTVRNFDHALTSWPLDGRHTKLECRACHANGKFGTTPESRGDMHYAPIAATDCTPCHADPHLGRFSGECSGCHVTSSFKEVPEGRFAHARTRFPLRGAHARVECGRCHDPEKGGWGARPAFAACGDCHADAHAGTATLAGQIADCDQCHGEETFERSTFDLARHASSVYPLEGKHQSVQCVQCHRKDTAVSRFGSAGVDLRPAHEACRDCHVDAHAGQLAHRADGGRCESCHTVHGWKPSTFDTNAHAAIGFALLGAHLTAECRSCHAPGRSWESGAPVDPGSAQLVLARPEETCVDCHVDVHRARYVDRSCLDCHDQRSFTPSSVGVAAHDRYAFPLKGAHRATPCFLCHKQLDSRSHLPDGTHALRGEVPPPDVVLWEVPSACQACHKMGVSQ